MLLNKTIEFYSPIPEAQKAQESALRAAHTLGELLLTQPKGSYVDLGENEVLFVGPFEGQLELFITYNYENDIEPEECEAFLLNSPDGPVAEDWESFLERLQAWLAQPTYAKASPENLLERIAQSTENLLADLDRVVNAYMYDNKLD